MPHRISPTGYMLCPTGYHPQDKYCAPQDITHRIYIVSHRILPTGYILCPTGYHPQDIYCAPPDITHRIISLPQVTLFRPQAFIALATSGNIRAILKAVIPILESVNKHTPSGGWLDRLPSWRGNKHRRGLLGWGQMRDKTRQVINKLWAVPQLQRCALITALCAWMDFVGLPATRAGNST